jgi:phage tail sheath protein FI
MSDPGKTPISYPGVYIQELPSGGVTIAGIATSITAFIGRTLMGPSAPTQCTSFADFQRCFGGLASGYPLSYAVEDFFQNGGGDAIVVRAYKAPAAQRATGGRAALSVLNLVAASPGTWGNSLTASIETAADLASAAQSDADLFNLTLTYTQSGGQTVVERYTNVTVENVAAPNRLDRVLAAQSQLATVAVDPKTNQPDLPAGPPQSTFVEDAASGKLVDQPLAFTGGVDSDVLTADDLLGDADQRTGIHALDQVDLFNLLCIPDQAAMDYPGVYPNAALYCLKRRAMLIVDPPKAWSDLVRQGNIGQIQPDSLAINSAQLEARNCAVYFPRIEKIDQEMGSITAVFPACGAIAGIYATTDLNRGVWQAPAGSSAGIGGIVGLELNLTDEQNGVLNPIAINCLRSFPIYGPVVWGARTLRGADVFADDYKYVPVRRLTLYIEESLYRGTMFAVFEPNDETLWSQLRLSIGTFMADLARQGAFSSYQVTCDKTTTTPDDIQRGIVNIIVAFAPVTPAEFIIVQIQQQAGQISS